MSKQTLDKSVLDTICDPDCGTPEDKLRLAIIYYLCSNMSDVSIYDKWFITMKFNVMKFITSRRRIIIKSTRLYLTPAVIWILCCTSNDWGTFKNPFLPVLPTIYLSIGPSRSYTRISEIQNPYEGGGTKTVSMFSKLMNQGSSFVMEGVKNLVVKKHVSISIFVWTKMLIHFIRAEFTCDKISWWINGI